MSNKEKFHDFIKNHTKEESRDKVEKIIKDAEQHTKNGVDDVEDFFKNITEHVKDGSKEVVDKAKEEIKKIKK